jgi:hypothetical protein
MVGKGVYFARMIWDNLLLRGVVGERDTLLDVALQALDSSIKERLLLVGDVGKDVDGLLGTIGLLIVSSLPRSTGLENGLTPSSTGTEKKSTPAIFRISSPPGTPGR